jgi:Sec-independent protein translocase protein TatA
MTSFMPLLRIAIVSLLFFGLDRLSESARSRTQTGKAQA